MLCWPITVFSVSTAQTDSRKTSSTDGYDPCCGSSGMFVQSVEFIRAHATGNGNGGKAPKGAKADISFYGQESNYTTWRLAKMNLAIRGIEGQIAHGDSFHADRHPVLCQNSALLK